MAYSITEIVQQLADLGVSLPLRLHDEDMTTAVDASGSVAFVIDVNGEREDEDAMEITACLIELVNLAGSGPVPIQTREG